MILYTITELSHLLSEVGFRMIEVIYGYVISKMFSRPGNEAFSLLPMIIIE